MTYSEFVAHIPTRSARDDDAGNTYQFYEVGFCVCLCVCVCVCVNTTTYLVVNTNSKSI